LPWPRPQNAPFDDCLDIETCLYKKDVPLLHTIFVQNGRCDLKTPKFVQPSFFNVACGGLKWFSAAACIPTQVNAMADNKTDKHSAEVLAIALAAGLEKVVAQFPDDVIAAAQAAAQDRDDMPAIESTTAPWPPMRMKSER
jgi:hypothetical protein